MIFTDGVHLVSSESLEELHKFAHLIGLKKEWFQDHKRHPHYDITTKRKLKKALERGAQLTSKRKILLYSMTMK